MSVDPRAAQAGNPAAQAGKGKSVPVGTRVRSGLSFIGDIVNAFTTVNRFRLSAILLWLVGVYTTSIVLTYNISNSFPTTGVGSIIGGVYGGAILGAFVLQLIMSTFEAPIFQGKDRSLIPVVVLLVDMGINSIITKGIAQGIIGSGGWDNMAGAVSEITYTIASAANVNWRLGIGSGPVVEYILMLLFAFIIAAGPEFLWNLGGKKG